MYTSSKWTKGAILLIEASTSAPRSSDASRRTKEAVISLSSLRVGKGKVYRGLVVCSRNKAFQIALVIGHLGVKPQVCEVAHGYRTPEVGVIEEVIDQARENKILAVDTPTSQDVGRRERALERKLVPMPLLQVIRKDHDLVHVTWLDDDGEAEHSALEIVIDTQVKKSCEVAHDLTKGKLEGGGVRRVSPA